MFVWLMALASAFLAVVMTVAGDSAGIVFMGHILGVVSAFCVVFGLYDLHVGIVKESAARKYCRSNVWDYRGVVSVDEAQVLRCLTFEEVVTKDHLTLILTGNGEDVRECYLVKTW